MAKIYTNGDNTFTGDNTFEKGIDVSTTKIANLATPTADDDGANKSYVDGKDETVVIGTNYTWSTSSSGASNLVTCAITGVPENCAVLLLAAGSVQTLDGDEFIQVYFKRGTTELNNNSSESVDVGSTENRVQIPFTMSYLDTSPGTGSVTYSLYGGQENGDGYSYGLFTLIVFKMD